MSVGSLACGCPRRLDLALLALFVASSAGAELVPLGWQVLEVGLREGGIAAVALAPDGARLAVGGARGVAVGDGGSSFSNVLRRGPVRDLAFLPAEVAAGALLVATDAGLYRVDADGRAEQLALGPGEGVRAVSRIAAAPAAIAVATAGGAFVSRDARRWQPLSAALPSGAAATVALRAAEQGVDAWAVIEGSVWRTRLHPGATGFAPAPAVRETLPFAAQRGGPVDLAFDLAGADAVVAYPSALAVRSAPDASWHILRPNLPPGSRVQRVAAAGGRVWLATDRGLLEAATLGGPWRRAQGRPGSAATHAVAGDARRVFAATASGLAASRADVSAAKIGAGVSSTALVGIELPREPPIGQVHRAVLQYLELGRGPVEALRRGVARRGWLPVLSFGVGRDRSRDRSTDFDQAFLSGGLRNLVDHDDSRSEDFDLGVTLSWDLGDAAYHPEAIDVSREAREVIELRDDVLDEVTQLYFERRRVLLELASRPDPWDAEAVRLRLRADELAAGIDAWTGGWFAARVPPLAP